MSGGHGQQEVRAPVGGTVGEAEACGIAVADDRSRHLIRELREAVAQLQRLIRHRSSLDVRVDQLHLAPEVKDGVEPDSAERVGSRDIGSGARWNGRSPPYDLRDPTSRPARRVTPRSEHRGEFRHLHLSGLTSLVERSDDVSPRAAGSVGPGLERLTDGGLDPPSSLTKPSAQSPILRVGSRGRPWTAAERSEQAVVQRQRSRRSIDHADRRPPARESIQSSGQEVHDASVRRRCDRGGAVGRRRRRSAPPPRDEH